MGVYKNGRMSKWLAALAVSVTCFIATEQTAFSVKLGLDYSPPTYNFSDVMFERFYHCLRNTGYSICDAPVSNSGSVIMVKGCQGKNLLGYDTFTCALTAVKGFACKRGEFAPADMELSCLANYSVERSASQSSQALLKWFNVIGVEMISYRSGISVSHDQSYTFVIKGSLTTTLQTTTETTTKTTTRTTINAGSGQQTSVSSDSSTTAATNIGSSVTDGDIDDGDNMTIIIVAAVGGAVVLAIIIIVIILLWRRKKMASSSSATSVNKTNYHDTDISPYGESTLSNINPIVNSNSLNSNPNQLAPDASATVDLSKKLNAKTSSDANNANSNNSDQSQQKNTHLSSNLDHTEVDMDNDAPHYQNSPDDANNDEEASQSGVSLPPPPPELLVKPSFGTSPDSDENPSEAYAQVMKKSEGTHVANGEGEGSNPVDDSSGSEEVVPYTDTQYTQVDPSAKTDPKPAAAGVYAKLHDPVRNITDVYNEWPATENAGE